MSKFKPGDKVVVEIEAIEYFGELPMAYRLTCGINLPMNVLDKADLLPKAAKAPAKKSTKK